MRWVLWTVALPVGIALGCDGRHNGNSQLSKPLIASRARPQGPQNVVGAGAGVTPRACSDVIALEGRIEATTVVSPTASFMASSPNTWITDVAVASDGTMYLVDRSNSRIIHIDDSGNLLGTITPADRRPYTLRSVAVRSDRSVLVGSTGGRISIFGPDGSFSRVLSAKGFQETADVIGLDGGNSVVASTFARHVDGKKRTPYVKMIHSSGKVRDLLTISGARSIGKRPLLAKHNEVQLSAGPSGRFAVWYPLDNYVEVFDSTAALIARIEGCLPEILEQAYNRRLGTESEEAMELTLGVSFDGPERIRVASRYRREDGGFVLRLRRYTLDGIEVEARDYDLPHGNVTRVEFAGDSFFVGLVAFQNGSTITRNRMR